jgi:hypothetical protein
MQEQAPKPGIKTSEFWATAVVNIVSAVVAILAVRGLVDPREGQLYVVLAEAIVAALAPVIMAFTTRRYIASREAIKTASSQLLAPEPQGDSSHAR